MQDFFSRWTKTISNQYMPYLLFTSNRIPLGVCKKCKANLQKMEIREPGLGVCDKHRTYNLTKCFKLNWQKCGCCWLLPFEYSEYTMGGSRGGDRGSRHPPGKSQGAIDFLRNMWNMLMKKKVSWYHPTPDGISLVRACKQILRK